MYAIIQLNGKQYKVSQGDVLTIDRVETNPGETLEVTDVLLVSDGSKIQVGQPTVNKAKVSLKVVDHNKGDKIRVATYKSKSRYRKVKGHRQYQTQLEVIQISA